MVDLEGEPRRKRPAPTTQLTLRHYRKLGYACDVAEYWNAFAGIRKDLFGFVDLCAVRKGELLLIQTTSWSNISSRRNKIAGLDAAGLLASVPGVKIIIIGWRKNASGRWEFKSEAYVGTEA